MMRKGPNCTATAEKEMVIGGKSYILNYDVIFEWDQIGNLGWRVLVIGPDDTFDNDGLVSATFNDYFPTYADAKVEYRKWCNKITEEGYRFTKIVYYGGE